MQKLVSDFQVILSKGPTPAATHSEADGSALKYLSKSNLRIVKTLEDVGQDAL